MGDATKFLKGLLLLDGGKLKGSYFHRTVVLVCHHDAEGAFGLVLNRPSGKNIGDAIVADLPDHLKDVPLFLGGPVQNAALSFLHTDQFVPHANVIPNLNLDHSLDSLVEIGESYSTTQKVKVFAGYAGWSPGQLESEMERQAWVTYPATIDLVFHSDTDQLWRAVLRKKGGEYRLLAEAPDDLSWN